MIKKSELGWVTDAYNDFLSEIGNPAFSFVVEAYSLDVSIIEEGGVGTPSEDTNLDSILIDDRAIRVYLSANTIHVERLLNEDSADQAWVAESSISVSDLDENVAPSLAQDGSNLRVFYYNTDGEIMQRTSTNKGTSWLAEGVVATQSGVAFIAAVTTTRCHYGYVTEVDNFRLCVATYNGSWSADNSYVLWPFTPTSLDAVVGNQLDDAAASTNDIIGFTTDLPPYIGYRVDGTELVQYLERVQGIVFFRYQNGRWSEHCEVDRLDNVPSANLPARSNLRLSKVGEWIFATYKRVDGSASFGHTALGVMRSKTGLHWEMPYLLPENKVGTCAKLIKMGGYVYLVDSRERKQRSPSVGYVDDSRVSHDLTDYVIAADVSSGDMKNLSITLGNPQGVLDTIFDQERMWRMRLKTGWYIDGAPVLVQNILADLENASSERQIPVNHKVLQGRNELARPQMTRADHVQEWQNTQVGGDNFKSLDGTKYSGLRHTAGMAGHWEATNEVLQLRSGSEPGVAFNLQTSNVWNGSGQVALKWAKTDSDDFAGLILRAHNKYNFWHVTYNAESDKISLLERKDNVDITVHKSGGVKGWSLGTWYWLKVAFWYNMAWVYTSTDGITWSLEWSYEMPGVSPSTQWTFTSIPIMRGSQGYIGHGYSEYNPSYPTPPWVPPPIDWEEPVGWPANVLVATLKGVWRTSSFGGPDDPMPTWSDVTGDLPTAYGTPPGTHTIEQVAVDHTDSDIWWILTRFSTNLYIYETTDGGSNYTLILENGDLIGGNPIGDVQGIGSDRTTGELYAGAYMGAGGSYYNKIGKWNGSTWTWDTVGSTTADFMWSINVDNGYLYWAQQIGTTNGYESVKGQFQSSYSITNTSVGISTWQESPGFLHPFNDCWFRFWFTVAGGYMMKRIEDGDWPNEDLLYLDDDVTYFETFLWMGQVWGSQVSAAARFMQEGVALGTPSGVPSELRHSSDLFDDYSKNQVKESGKSVYLLNASTLSWYVSAEEDDYCIVGLVGYTGGSPIDDAGGYESGHHIGVIDVGVSASTITMKAGNDVASGSLSIPYDAGILCHDAIQILGLKEV